MVSANYEALDFNCWPDILLKVWDMATLASSCALTPLCLGYMFIMVCMALSIMTESSIWICFNDFGEADSLFDPIYECEKKSP